MINVCLILDIFLRYLAEETFTRLAIAQVFLMGIVLINWLRVFETTVIYIRLIKQTVIDMTPFAVLLFVIVALFSFAILILNMTREKTDALYNEDISKSDYLNALMSQYLLTLGEFDLENFSKAPYVSNYDPNSGTDWIIFTGATLFVQIILLNMLIAIMSASFDSIFENKKQFVLSLKLEVLSDYSFLFSEKVKGNFLFVASLLNKEEESGVEWEGRIKAITKSLRDRFDALKTDILSKIKKMAERDAEITK